eukprot:1194784-Prorocentrum_minimum.AAC.4
MRRNSRTRQTTTRRQHAVPIPNISIEQLFTGEATAVVALASAAIASQTTLTSFYGSSYPINGKGALNTPETLRYTYTST